MKFQKPENTNRTSIIYSNINAITRFCLNILKIRMNCIDKIIIRIYSKYRHNYIDNNIKLKIKEGREICYTINCFCERGLKWRIEKKNYRLCWKIGKLKRIAAAALTMCMIAVGIDSIAYATEMQVAQYQWDEAQLVVENLFDAVQKENWSEFTEYMCQEEQSFYEEYFSNDELCDGIKQINSIEVLNVYRVDSSLAENEWLMEEYSILQTSNEIYSFIVEVDCSVVEENKYFFEGINYFHIVVALEDEDLKVVQFNKPSTTLLEEIVEPELLESDENYSEQIAGMKVIESAEKGLIVNAKQEIIIEGFTTIEQTNESGISTLSADPVVLSHYATYSYPTYIDVKLNQTGNNEIVRVPFTDYMKNVLPNEWIPSWNSVALTVGAYCVKMVGIYRALNPMSSAGGYDLTQSTQMYKPGSTLYTSTSNAIDSIKNQGMATSNYFIFFPSYSAGTEGSVGTKASGNLKQWGSQKMATQGYTYVEILTTIIVDLSIHREI